MLKLVAPLLLDMARAARAVSVPKFRTGLITELKKDKTPVSAIDRATEERLREFVPQAEKLLGASVGFRGEEFPTLNPDAEFLFVVDPIDGTKPYLLGRSEWFTLIGLYQKGAGFVAGLCDQPDVDRAHYAAKGEGAWMLDRKNLDIAQAARLPKAPEKPLDESILLSFDPLMMPPYAYGLYEKLYKQVMYAVPGGDAGNYVRLAEGTGQIVLESVGGIYDLVALTPLVTETGGTLVCLNPDGTTFAPDMNFHPRFPVLSTSSPALLDAVLKIYAA